MENLSLGREVLKRNIPYILAIAALAGIALADHLTPPKALDVEPLSEEVEAVLDDDDSAVE